MWTLVIIVIVFPVYNLYGSMTSSNKHLQQTAQNFTDYLIIIVAMLDLLTRGGSKFIKYAIN